MECILYCYLTRTLSLLQHFLKACFLKITVNVQKQQSLYYPLHQDLGMHSIWVRAAFQMEKWTIEHWPHARPTQTNFILISLWCASGLHEHKAHCELTQLQFFFYMCTGCFLSFFFLQKCLESSTVWAVAKERKSVPTLGLSNGVSIPGKLSLVHG